MKKLKSYLLIALSMCMLTSCLDKYPQDEIPAGNAITSIEEADQAVVGIYSSWLSGALYSGYLTLLPDLQADFAYAVNGYTNTYGDVWRWDILATNSQITSVYGALYNVIGCCNFLLANVDKVRENIFNDEDFDRLEQYCGEAYFARALAYSELIKLFCKAYDSDEMAEKELGVVLRKEYYSNDSLVRASLKDSYQFVIEDLERAEDCLQLTKEEENDASLTFYSSPYFSIYTVYALRARVALYMKDYENAIKYSTLLIESGQFALSSASTEYTTMPDYLTMTNKSVSLYEYMWRYNLSTETIWEVGFTTTSYGGALGSIFFNWDFASYKPDYVPAQWVLELYTANDLRYSANFTQVTTGHSHGLTWPLLSKYWGNQELFDAAQLVHVCEPQVFRLSEQYLIRAEAYAQQKNYAKASKDIEELRKARYSSSASASLNEDNAMDVIEEERVKELYMEGFRLQDLKRWHKGFERTPQEQSLSNGSSLKIEKDNPLFVWPIPQHELESPDANIKPNESNK